MLKVMTFNIRYRNASDGLDSWPKRRHLAIQAVRDCSPHIVGLQEALDFQLEYMASEMHSFGSVGVGRDDGRRGGEHAAILYCLERCECLESGTFWFSDTPQFPGSKSWGNTLPRICTWARFRDLVEGHTFHVFNVHWDHVSQRSRELSAGLLLSEMKRLAGDDARTIVTGDFNVPPDNPAFTPLLSSDTGLKDTLSESVSVDGSQGTFHEFSGKVDGARIDAVLCSEAWSILSAEIVTYHVGQSYPSDHFPVLTTLE